MLQDFTQADSAGEPLYKNLLPAEASANGGYENLETVVSKNYIYQNQEHLSRPLDRTDSNGSNAEQSKPQKPSQLSNVAASSQVISLAPSRMVRFRLWLNSEDSFMESVCAGAARRHDAGCRRGTDALWSQQDCYYKDSEHQTARREVKAGDEGANVWLVFH